MPILGLQNSLVTASNPLFPDTYSLNFDGSDEHIEFGNVTALNIGTGSFTVACWLKTPTEAGNSVIAQKYNGTGTAGWAIRYHGSNNNIYIDLSDGTNDAAVTSGSGLTDGQWYHIAITHEAGKTLSLYVNGSFNVKDDDAGDVGDIDNSNNFRIGMDEGSTKDFYGHISDFVFYNTNLSVSNISTIYNSGSPYDHQSGTLTSNLIGWWQMGDGIENATGTTIYDMSDNSNNGTMTNMTADAFETESP